MITGCHFWLSIIFEPPSFYLDPPSVYWYSGYLSDLPLLLRPLPIIWNWGVIIEIAYYLKNHHLPLKNNLCPRYKLKKQFSIRFNEPREMRVSSKGDWADFLVNYILNFPFGLLLKTYKSLNLLKKLRV